MNTILKYHAAPRLKLFFPYCLQDKASTVLNAKYKLQSPKELLKSVNVRIPMPRKSELNGMAWTSEMLFLKAPQGMLSAAMSGNHCHEPHTLPMIWLLLTSLVSLSDSSHSQPLVCPSGTLNEWSFLKYVNLFQALWLWLSVFSVPALLILSPHCLPDSSYLR